MVKMPFEKKKDSDSVDVEKLIDKGAPVKEESKAEEKEWAIINIRIKKEMLDQIDKEVSNDIGLSRTAWLIRAIHKQLKIASQEKKE
jgi:hypothetical protein